MVGFGAHRRYTQKGYTWSNVIKNWLCLCGGDPVVKQGTVPTHQSHWEFLEVKVIIFQPILFEAWGKKFSTCFDSPLSWLPSSTSSSSSSTSSSTSSSPVQPCLESKHDLHPVHPLPHPPLRPRHPLEAQAQLWHRHFPASDKARQGSPHHHHFTPKHLSII